MNLHRSLLAATIFLTVSTSHAQYFGGSSAAAPAYPSVSVGGSSSVKRLPETVRVILTVQGKGKTFDEALAKLKAAQNDIVDKIQKIGFGKERIRIDEFGLDRSQDDKRRQMSVMIAQRARQSGARKKTTVPETVSLKCMIFAEQPLTGKTEEEIMKECYALQDKIKSADLVPKDDAPTPEEEELAEEMGGMHFSSSNDSRYNTEPRFLYVAKISEADAQKAYADAVDEAKKAGRLLVESAGAKLGMLMQLSGGFGVNRRSSDPYSSNQDYYLMNMINAQQVGARGAVTMEGLSNNAEMIEFNVNVQAIFKMENQ